MFHQKAVLLLADFNPGNSPEKKDLSEKLQPRAETKENKIIYYIE